MYSSFVFSYFLNKYTVPLFFIFFEKYAVPEVSYIVSKSNCSGRFRYFEYEGNRISPWHDIPLFSPDGYVHMVTEIPKFSRAKFEIATGEPFNPIKQDTKNGKLREYNYGDMCFNYGAFPQTWEMPDHLWPGLEDLAQKGDNDPLDIVDLSEEVQACGSIIEVKPVAVLAMIDEGEVAHGGTRVSGTPRGAQFDREGRFVDDAGKVLVRALTRWAMLDAQTLRPARVTAEIAAPFMAGR